MYRALRVKGNISAILLSLVMMITLLSVVGSSWADEGFKPGAKAADFTLSDMTGKQVSLSQFSGKVVMLNFWAMWCRPCRAEMPSMEKLYGTYKEKDFVILAVSMDHKEKSEVVEFIKKSGYTFPVLLDPDNTLSENYKVPYIPATFIIDRQGQIVSREYGARKWDSVAAKGKIEELLSKK